MKCMKHSSYYCRKHLTVGTKVDGSLEEDFPDEPSVGDFLGSTSSFSGYIYQHLSHKNQQ